MRGLFAGYGSFLLRDLPFDAIEFVAYEQLKSMYKVCLKAILPSSGFIRLSLLCQTKDSNIATSA